MNQEQRDRLQKAFQIIEEVCHEEEEKLENMSENFSETERYELMEEKKESLDEALDSLNQAIGEGGY